MSQPNRARASASSRPSAIRNRRPPPSPESSRAARLFAGLILSAALVLSLLAILKPLAPRTQYLVVTPPAGTTQARVQAALAATGALPNPAAITVSPDGPGFTVASASASSPVASNTWRALERTLPGKLAGARVEFRADRPRSIGLGLDLQGGLRVVLQAQTAKPSLEDVERIRTILENRVNQTGVAEPLVQVQGTDRVVVELPGLSQAQQQQALRLIGQTAKLEFRIVNPEAAGKTDKDLILSDLGPVAITGEAVRNARAAFDQFGRPMVSMEFTADGARKIDELTGSSIGKRLAIVLDGQVKTAPAIQGRISGGSGVINGIGSVQDASETALVLRSGALPVPIRAIETRAIGPTLGQDAIRSGLLASAVGMAAVLVLVFAYYGPFFGLVAALGLIFSGVLIFGLLAGLGAILTLPGIAGLVLTIGAAVDGNVISFERVKEELRAGKGARTAVASGFGHSLATILDVNLSHLIAAIALYNYSTGPVKGFAVTLAVGVLASTFSNLVFSKWMLEGLASRPSFGAPQWFATPKIDFMAASRFITAASIALAILGAGVIVTRGFVWGVDFTSGTSLTLRTDAGVTSDLVRSAVGGATIEGVTEAGAAIVETRTPGIQGKDFTVRVGELDDAGKTRMAAALVKLPGGQVIQTESVGPAVGNELREATVTAVLVALGLILVYVGFRFDLIFGVGSVIAVLHDVAIVMGLFALLGREFSITTVAAILTLIGYSLNDSIIVSDRIRENLRLMRGRPYDQIVNQSINQTLSRTIMTSVSTMLPLIALLVLGGPVLRDFSLALIVGILVGTYSSIFIVAPMAVQYKQWQASRPGRRHTSPRSRA